MLSELFRGIFDSDLVSVISIPDFILCVGMSLILGLAIAFSYMFRTKYTKSFVATLAILPAVVCVVIMMVNGNVGAGVAVAGAFSLVRFRSIPGTAKEIGALFLSMGVGLITGMGYIAYAVLFTVILCAAVIVYGLIGLGSKKNAGLYRTMRITIPEDLDYDGVFEPLISEYADELELTEVKTTNMGSLFRLTYDLKLKAPGKEKELIDKLRCRNGNLEISLSKQQTLNTEL